ncbi:hypothetical protein [Shewanella sp. 1180_01]|uniref:hypothetical protein n=1 Tax=Shewanella sp. 1180_01 TaxID=2604451 RepID=UPI0040630040
MSHNQKVAFWSMFIMFCVGATASIYPQGAFDNITLAGSIIITGFYLIVALFIRKYVKSNPKDIDKWFQK